MNLNMNANVKLKVLLKRYSHLSCCLVNVVLLTVLQKTRTDLRREEVRHSITATF